MAPPLVPPGSFLIASPEIDSTTLARSVILLCDHHGAGSFGLIVNKPLSLEIPPDMLNAEEISNPHIQMRLSGPLRTSDMMLLHTSDEIKEHALHVCEGVYLGGDLNFLQQMATKASGPSMLLCFGYAGWGPGMLEEEVAAKAWFVHPATSSHIFQTPSDKLWSTLLSEMGGSYAKLASIPEDPSLN